MDPKYDVDEDDPTQRFKNIAAVADTGSHRYSSALGDAVGDIGRRLSDLTNIVNGIRITQSSYVQREEVAKIAKAANGQLEGQVSTLNRLVFGVLLAIPVGLLIHWLTTHL